jgi:site-specific DNA-methyltransferase (adenine-specific)
MLKEIKSDSVDCMVTDPPYGISFMNKDWDKAVPDIAIWKECIRVMKAGAFAFVMCSPRSDVQAEMVIKLKEAGFEVGFTPIYWTFSQGFPKAANTSLLVDKKACMEDLLQKLRRLPTKSEFEEAWGKWRNVIGYKGNEKNFRDLGAKTKEQEGINKLGIGITAERTDLPLTTPHSQEAQTLAGSYLGFQPKPSIEVILVAMKPLSEKTYVDQALKNGKGITWLDDGRIPYQSDKDRDSAIFGTQTDIRGNNYNTNRPSEGNIFNRNVLSSEIGRFPANLLVQDNVLDNGIISKSGGVGGRSLHGRGEGYGFRPMGDASPELPSDEGSFSRYFSLDAWYSKNMEELPDYVQRIYPFLYVPKASNSERNEDLNTFNEQTVNDGRKKDIDNPFQRGETLRKNIHPTVKPVKLISFIVTIGSRPGDTILDPFMGSGTTGVAAKILHRDFIGFEIEGKYFEIAQERIEKRAATRDIFEFDAMNEMEYEEK